ncbi:RNA polymerase sigma factor [Thalassoroseus pseudoceratinae]|uniref:RNA polymerase sigma factor n=1 Tax=Thalassoroseus pseudoceratinae TaxID=2713176 RepID=UPI001422A234|nr:sigma-70 family RNA polymerase sigma factor [Thalassoroseus pseudoceratinae]
MAVSTRESLLLRLKQTNAESVCNQEAWVQFVELYGPIVYSRCLRAGLQSVDSQGVTQDVFFRVYKAIGRFDYDRTRGRFRDWLYRITQNEICRFITRGRKNADAVGGGLADHLLDQSTEHSGSEWNDDVNQRIYELASERVRDALPNDWLVFQQLWEESKSPAEVASCFGKTRAWVYQVKYRVVRQLEAEVERLSEDQFPFQGFSSREKS